MFDRLKSLAVFAKVAEVRSFSGAAKALGITAPVVSQHVTQLEKDLDVALVYRSTRSLRLTDAGEKLSISVMTMLDVAESGIDAIVEDDSKPHGKLRVSTPGIDDYEPFLDGLTKYMELFPEVDLTVSFENNVVDLIKDGFDMGIRNADSMTDSSLISRKLIESQLILACSPEYRDSCGPISHPNDLIQAGYKTIKFTQRQFTKLRRKDNHKEIVELEIPPSITVNSHLAGHNLAVRHNGLTSISMLDHKDSLEDRSLIEPLPEWEFEPIAFYAVWPANAGSRSLIRHFLNFILTEIAKGEYLNSTKN